MSEHATKLVMRDCFARSLEPGTSLSKKWPLVRRTLHPTGSGTGPQGHALGRTGILHVLRSHGLHGRGEEIPVRNVRESKPCMSGPQCPRQQLVSCSRKSQAAYFLQHSKRDTSLRHKTHGDPHTCGITARVFRGENQPFWHSGRCHVAGWRKKKGMEAIYLAYTALIARGDTTVS